MFLLLVEDMFLLVGSIFYWILIGTIVLGSIFALVAIIMIAKKIRYAMQMRHNKREVSRYKKRLLEAKEERSLYEKMEKENS